MRVCFVALSQHDPFVKSEHRQFPPVKERFYFQFVNFIKAMYIKSDWNLLLLDRTIYKIRPNNMYERARRDFSPSEK